MRVGPQGRVQATDAVAGMVDGLRTRIARRGLSNVTADTAPMERLPYGDASFDAATCRYGLMYVDDPVAALREVRRVLRPGGRVALMVWGPEEDNTLVWPVFRAIQSVAPDRLSEAEVVRPLRFAAAGCLSPVLRDAGFDDVREDDVVLRPKVRRGVPYWAPLVEMNAGQVWSTLDAAQRAEVERRLGDATERFAEGDAYRFTTHFRVATGTRR
jgi:SAM-dependent methyltransferase